MINPLSIHPNYHTSVDFLLANGCRFPTVEDWKLYDFPVGGEAFLFDSRGWVVSVSQASGLITVHGLGKFMKGSGTSN